MDPSDADLWVRSRAGDRGAFGLLFERHWKPIFNYCFRRTGDREAARDMLQVVFLEAWRRRDKELPPDKVLPWLYGIATNVVRNQRRSRRRFASALSRLPRGETEPGFAEDAADRIDYERQTQEALARLHSLPKREQDIFVLCLGMDLSYEEAAFALNIPIGTVRSRLSSARARLHELDHGNGHEQDESTNVQEASQP